ncbi:putative proteasome maturation factor ump1 [Elsinoe australis]|uniref:Putative proteasome maturation factor ump1 n=1 Tax=Elsinoe australis TaxID=40998 RepID=A0A4V6DWV7_9PEZI|nr:putative proteasome maturation factor ump1 [Elsinoe australis]
MSLLLVPPPSHATSTHQTTSAPSAPGVPDPLRQRLALTNTIPPKSGPSTVTDASYTQRQSSHPLETRLSQWRAQTEATKMNMLGRQYGIAEPVRRRLELQACAAGEWRPACLGGEGRSFGSVWGSGSSVTGSGVHADILLGRETEVGWEDVFVDDPLRRQVDFHTEMEGRVRMNAW